MCEAEGYTTGDYRLALTTWRARPLESQVSKHLANKVFASDKQKAPVVTDSMTESMSNSRGTKTGIISI